MSWKALRNKGILTRLREDAEKERRPTTAEQALIQESLAATEGASMEGLEAERQRLWRIHHGQLEGYDAKQKTLAGKLAARLEQTMREHSPEYGKYLDKFAEASKPLEPFAELFFDIPAEHMFEKELPKLEGAEVVRRVFASRDSFNKYRGVIEDDEKAFEYARTVAATELDQLLKNKLSKPGRGILRDYWNETVSARRTSDSIDGWTRQNTWIEDVPGLKEKVGKIRAEFSSIYTNRIGAAVLIGLAAAGLIVYLVLQP